MCPIRSPLNSLYRKPCVGKLPPSQGVQTFRERWLMMYQNLPATKRLLRRTFKKNNLPKAAARFIYLKSENQSSCLVLQNTRPQRDKAFSEHRAQKSNFCTLAFFVLDGWFCPGPAPVYPHHHHPRSYPHLSSSPYDRLGLRAHRPSPYPNPYHKRPDLTPPGKSRPSNYRML